MTIRVLLVDDHHLIREGLRRALETDLSFEVVGEAGGLVQATRMADALRPDLLLVDVSLPDGNGIDLVRGARSAHPEAGIVVLTMHDDDNRLFEALEAGASAFVSKNSSTDEVLAAARHAASAPLTFTARDLAGAMQRRLSSQRQESLLSAREAEVLALLAQGMSTSEVGRAIFVSTSTAKTHIARLYQKLGARNRTEAVMAAVHLGLLTA